MTELDLVSLKADLLAGLDQRLRQGVRIGDGPGRTMRRRLRPAGTISDTLKVRFPSQLNANVMASFLHQVGRASCRERVCRDVSIPVAAVYLKQTDNHHCSERRNKKRNTHHAP